MTLARTVLRKLVRPLKGVVREAGYASRRLYHAVFAGDVRCVGRVELAAGVRLETNGAGTIVLGDGVHLSRGVTIIAQGGVVELGEKVFIGEWSTITAKQRVVLGERALVAERVTIRDQDHDTHGPPGVPIAEAGFHVSPVLIGDDVWLAAGSVVLRGVQIGDGAVVAANAVVVDDVPAGTMVGGVPARTIGVRPPRPATRDHRSAKAS